MKIFLYILLLILPLCLYSAQPDSTTKVDFHLYLHSSVGTYSTPNYDDWFNSRKKVSNSKHGAIGEIVFNDKYTFSLGYIRLYANDNDEMQNTSYVVVPILFGVTGLVGGVRMDMYTGFKTYNATTQDNTYDQANFILATLMFATDIPGTASLFRFGIGVDFSLDGIGVDEYDELTYQMGKFSNVEVSLSIDIFPFLKALTSR